MSLSSKMPLKAIGVPRSYYNSGHMFPLLEMTEIEMTPIKHTESLAEISTAVYAFLQYMKNVADCGEQRL